MSFKTTIQPSQHTFPVAEGETILEAALEHGLVLPYSCRNGACGVCKGKVLEGKVDFGDHQSYALTDEEKAEGMARFCCA
jgi:CDP-4-dehydro-6-deoxyglucose reductase